MPAIRCPIPNCDYITEDVDAGIVAALLTAHTLTHSQAQGTGSAGKAEKVKRPTIAAGGSSEDWYYFKIRWQEYVTATKITGQDKILQLLECCDENLRKDLTRSSGGSVTNKSEEQVLSLIQQLAVQAENTMVARVTLHGMRQDRDEPIRAFTARVRGQANICKFVIECPNDNCKSNINYTDHVIKDVITRGISDHDIQLDLLGEQNQDMTLDEVVKYIEAKEAGKRSATRLHDSSTDSLHAISQYKNKQKTELKEKLEICQYCGKTGHGTRASAKDRKQFCKAFGQKCEKCLKDNHYASVCRSKPRVQQSADSLMLCSVYDQGKKRNEGINHHVFDPETQNWVQSKSKDQPIIDVQVKVTNGLNFTPPPRSKVCTQKALADTGCQSCLAGINLLTKLGVSKTDLLPVQTKIKTANNSNIPLLGAIPLSLTAQGQSSNQLTYITDAVTDKLFLSREACTDLKLIDPAFPFRVDNICGAAFSEDNCNCPKREKPPPPPTLPYPATDANREKLQQYLLDYYRSSTFNTCSNQTLPMMEGPPLHLMVDPDAEPVAHHTPIPVPLHWQEEVKKGLDQDVRLGVLEPVPVGEPVTWCHRMVVCAKKNGKPRRTVDLQKLNQHATRETHHTPSPFHQARSVPQGKKKTVLDAWNGYHSVPIRPEDRHLTTFITPWGRYRYRSTPQGYIAAGDGYTRRYDEIVSHIPNKTKCIDDALLWADTLEESFYQTVKWLDICGRHGITLNPKKFTFGEDTVEFAGFQIGLNDVKPAKHLSEAILKFPSPKSLTDLRSWFGLINQVAYTFSVAKETQPFRDLLKPKATFLWTNELEDLFQKSKRNIINEMEEGVKIFDKARPTCIATDWSKLGLGFWVLQKHCDCTPTRPFCCHSGWKISLVGSRFTHSAEANYAPIEGEALAVVEALQKARYFVLGCDDLTIAVDHKPLLKIFGDRSLNEINNPRLRNLKEKTLGFRFQMVHISGKKQRAADTVSRHPTGKAEKLVLEDDIASLEHDEPVSPSLLLNFVRHSAPETESIEPMSLSAFSLSSKPLQNVTWDRVRIATTSELHHLYDIIQTGFPNNRQDMPSDLREYYQFQNDLTTVDGVILYKTRVVIPPSLRHEVIDTLHAAHQGTTSMLARAETTVFWPGITLAIHNKRSTCHSCNRNAPSNPYSPPTPLAIPDYPFQLICADFFHYKGQHYLVIVDRYSNWPIVDRADNGTKGLIDCLKRTFTTFGIAEELSSDGGPEFTSATFQSFLTQWGVRHRISSVAFAHSNCRAEIGVKTVKRLLMDNISADGSLNTDQFQHAILQYRNTPDRDTRLSPAQCIFGKPIRDFIPIYPGKYEPHPMWQDTLKRREDALRDRHIKCAERLSEHTRRLPPLIVGDKVRLQNQIGPHPLKWDRTGVVIEVRQFDQYAIRVDGSRRITLRNRKFLRKYIPALAPVVDNPTEPVPDKLVTKNQPPNLHTIVKRGESNAQYPGQICQNKPLNMTNHTPIILPHVPDTTLKHPDLPLITETPPIVDNDSPELDIPKENEVTDRCNKAAPQQSQAPRPTRIILPSKPVTDLEPRRSGRIKMTPKYLNDYVLNNKRKDNH